jgi:hypothetical protein
VLLAAALTGAILLAVHYRGEAAALRRQLRSTRVPVPRGVVGPALSSSTTALPSAGLLAGQVTAFVARSSSGLAQIVVTGQITGGRPHSRYELVGGDCTVGAAGRIWAAGVTNARGSADLTGHPQAVSVSHEYYLTLAAPGLLHDHPGPAVHGYFGIIRGLSAVPGGNAPCAPLTPDAGRYG